MRGAHLVFVIFFLAVWFLSCGNEPDCDLKIPSDRVQIAFFNDEDSTVKSLDFDRIRAAGSDSILYGDGDSLSVFTVYLNPSADTVAYYFVTGVRRDTLVLSYSRELEWLSEECGPNFRYENLEVSYDSFDNLQLVEPVLDYEINENIRVYH